MFLYLSSYTYEVSQGWFDSSRTSGVFLSLSSYTYEVSPVFLLVEEAVLKKMIEFIGWKEGDGIFNPGKYN